MSVGNKYSSWTPKSVCIDLMILKSGVKYINSPFWRFFFLNLDTQDSSKKRYHFPTKHTKVKGGDLFLQEFCGRPPSAESRQLYEAAKVKCL
ncbi:hypothetical protein CEXT_362331 [Caerostris extrusa]|uniref:Uncharacterized protein n=1 Tax=Caerostris extrusa TaxID=172846 RepID=A0AAV4QK99_CAEEX|nr:hypothetical protein CEXT_362331 [Caerostris extrusa]